MGSVLEAARRMLSPSARRARTTEREANRGPDANVIRNQSRDLFNRLDQGGVAYSNQQSVDLVDDTLQALEDTTPRRAPSTRRCMV